MHRRDSLGFAARCRCRTSVYCVGGGDRAIRDHGGILVVCEPQILDLRVTRGTLMRALQWMSELSGALAARGHRLVVTSGEGSATFARIGGTDAT